MVNLKNKIAQQSNFCMEKKMKKIAIYLLRFGLNFIYFFFKLLPARKNKVVFLSRQSNDLTLDFCRTQEYLKEVYPEVEIVTVCNRLEGESSGGLVNFAMSTLKSMYHMATATVCVLDAYWPAVSILHHKPCLTVVQMWHALGKIKQSGYQTLGRESGRSSEIAYLMKMHENYDFIIAGGEAWNPYYCQSFNTTEDKLVNCGLPRIDHLLETAEGNRKAVLNAYPQFEDKTIILYAPTFRRNIELHWEQLVDAVQEANRLEPGKDGMGQYVLVVKGHPNQKLEAGNRAGIYDCPEFKAVDLLAACDYLITDYSAIAIEGAILSRPTWYFVYDYEEYREKNGMNIDLFDVMPGCVYRDGKELMERLSSADRATRSEDGAQNVPYPYDVLEAYRKGYLPKELGTSTKQIVELILKEMKTEK